MANPVRWLIRRARWWRWFLSGPYRLGDPLLGSGETRQRNRDLLLDRWFAKEPAGGPKRKSDD